MEGRKLQLAGGSTYLVALPKHWVVDAGLKPGDTLLVGERPDGSVAVHAHPAERPIPRKKVFVERGDGTRDHLLRKLIGAYVSGFELVEVRFPSDQAAFIPRVARDFTRLVIGPEMIEESRNHVVIQDLSDTSELSSEKCLRRMHLMVRAMLQEVMLSLKSHDETLARGVAQREEDVDRLYWMVAKQHQMAHRRMNGSSGKDLSGIEHHRLVAKLLERIGDHAVRICNAVPRLGTKGGLGAKLTKELEGAGKGALEILDQAFGSLMSGNIDAANLAIDAREGYQKQVEELTCRVAGRKGEELLALGMVVDSLGRIASYGADIAEQAINVAVLLDEP